MRIEHWRRLPLSFSLCALNLFGAEAWSQSVPHEVPSYFFLVNKESNELSIRKLDNPNEVLEKYRSISGASPGDKEREGDKKTPEGIYFIQGEVPKARLQKLHGPAAFELNYPNVVDRIFKRGGSGIWIHGVDHDSRMDKRFDTRGCVALANADTLKLKEKFAKKWVPVVIVSDQAQIESHGVLKSQPDKAAYKKRVEDWLAAWSSSDANRYLTFYSTDFFANRMDYAAWTKYKTRLAKTYEFIKVSAQNIQVLNHGKYWVAVFEQNYESNRFKSFGIKRLYWVGPPESAQILSEEMPWETANSPEVSPSIVQDANPVTSQISPASSVK